MTPSRRSLYRKLTGKRLDRRSVPPPSNGEARPRFITGSPPTCRDQHRSWPISHTRRFPFKSDRGNRKYDRVVLVSVYQRRGSHFPYPRRKRNTPLSFLRAVTIECSRITRFIRTNDRRRRRITHTILAATGPRSLPPVAAVRSIAREPLSLDSCRRVNNAESQTKTGAEERARHFEKRRLRYKFEVVLVAGVPRRWRRDDDHATTTKLSEITLARGTDDNNDAVINRDIVVDIFR